MAERGNQAQVMASRAAETVARARASAGQLALFERPEPEAAEAAAQGPRKAGRPAGSKNRVKTELAKLLRAHGYRDPASQLAHLAGLNSIEDPRLQALALAQTLQEAASEGDAPSIERAERRLEEAQTKDERAAAWRNLMAAEELERRRAAELPGLVVQVMREMRQAADALMPYVFGKVTPDQVNALAAQMTVQIAAPGSASGADRRVAPPAMPSQGNQGVSEG